MKWTPKGNSSEAPIVVAARKVGLSETIANEYPRVLEVPPSPLEIVFFFIFAHIKPKRILRILFLYRG